MLKVKGSPALPSTTWIHVTSWVLLLYLHVSISVGVKAQASKAGLWRVFPPCDDTFVAMFVSF